MKETDVEQTEAIKPLRSVPLMTEEEMGKLARDMAMEKVFTNLHVPEEDSGMLKSIFMVAALGGLADVDAKQIGMIYEYLDRAGPRSVNGYPIFMSLRMVHREQVGPLMERVGQISRMLEEV